MVRRNKDMIIDKKFELLGGKGTVEMKHIFNSDELDDKIRIYCEITIPPHSSVGAHAHDGEEEVYYISKGVATVDDNGKKTILNAGDALHTSNGDYHSIANNTDEKMQFIALVVVC